MGTPEYQRWQGLTVRRPEDVRTAPGGPVPLLWQIEKHTEHHDRLMNLRLPADFPHEVVRGDASDALAVLALCESIRRDVDNGRAHTVRQALDLGASWPEVAAALGVEVDEAREVLRSWADGQRSLWVWYEEKGERPFGLDVEEYAAVLALCEAGSD